jgi:hypothetical protein
MEENFVITSSWWAGTGLVVYAIFLTIFFITTFAFIILAYKRSVLGWSRREGVHYALMMSCFTLIIATALVPFFFEFTSLKIAEDGTWTLKNGWSITLRTITRDEPRDVVYNKQKVTWYGKSYESYEAARIYVITDDKIYPSWEEQNQEKIKNIYRDLNATILEQRLEQPYQISENTNSPFSIYKHYQYIRYGLYGVLVIILIGPLIIFKKKSPKN